MLDSLNSRVEEVYRSCIGDNEANIRLVYFLLSWQPSVQVFDWWVVLVPVCWLLVQICTCMTNTVIAKKKFMYLHIIQNIIKFCKKYILVHFQKLQYLHCLLEKIILFTSNYFCLSALSFKELEFI